MSVSPNTRRRIAPAAIMLLAVLGSIALIVTFVMQVVSEAPPRGTDEARAEIISQIEESAAAGHPAEVGKLIPETLEVIDRTSNSILAFAFLTTTDTLGIGIQASDGGGGFGFGVPGEKTTRLMITDVSADYDLAVRRSGSGNGFEHTFTVK